MDFLTENMHAKNVDFVNANVSMPILSIRLWAKDGHRNIFDAEGGEYIHLATGESDPIVARHGVYFIKMRVDDEVIKDADSPFVRPGTA